MGKVNGARAVYAFRSYDSISMVLPVGLQGPENRAEFGDGQRRQAAGGEEET